MGRSPFRVKITKLIVTGNIPPGKLPVFVCLLLNGTSALFRPLVPRIVDRTYESC